MKLHVASAPGAMFNVNPFMQSGPNCPRRHGWDHLTNHVVIGPETTSATAEPSSPLVIVSKEQIVGRAWARYYPSWERCLL
jgi:hypothetical protein